MLEKVGTKDVIVRSYTSNYQVKEFIQGVLVPAAFPNIPMAKLNLGLTGIVSEMIGGAIEDSQGTAGLFLNEAFITKAVLPQSIYASAALFDLGYDYAVPSRCNFALQLWLPDILQYATRVGNTNTYRYYLDKDTTLVLGNSNYRLDYDIIIDYQHLNGNLVFSVYYDMSEKSSFSKITSQYVKHQLTSINWLVLFVELSEFERKVETNPIVDNLVTSNRDITIRWPNQIAGVDLHYITPQGERIPMQLLPQYSRPIVDPFVWYKFTGNNSMTLMFSSNKAYFVPSFNSKIESVVYSCRGKPADFDTYDRTTGIPVEKTGDRFDYNSNTRMVALCSSGSQGGLDRGDIEELRRKVIKAYNTAKVLTTDHDMKLWFDEYARRYNTRAEFFKRRDDPGGRLFSQFIAIVDDTNYVYPTNTLTIDVDQSECDYVNTSASGESMEFIIKPGHLWEYADEAGNVTRDRVRMVHGMNGPAMISDEALPTVGTDRPFMFVNPFYIKINKDPMASATYNNLINHTSWPIDVEVHSDLFYQFQLATLSVERNMTDKVQDVYKIQVICVPVVSDSNMKYINGIGDEFPVDRNQLRMVLITRSGADGETGYIEMTPVEIRKAGGYVFEANIAVKDNLAADMSIEVDMERTEGMKSLITVGEHVGKVFLDAVETSIHFACLMKSDDNRGSGIYNDARFNGYVMTNRFANVSRDLTLYKPMNMMRSAITFAGTDGEYKIRASLIPFLKWDVPFDSEKMAYFIRAFGEQYRAMEPVTSVLDGNSFLDFKLFNTYGRSSNYYIGPQEGKPNLWDSDILLDNVYVNVSLRISVFDRSMYTQTVDGVVQEIQKFFDSLSSGETKDIHVSDIIHLIKQNCPNVNYIRSITFNDYDSTKQSIFVKYDDISELREDQLHVHVPEMIRVDSSSISITEEV